MFDKVFNDIVDAQPLSRQNGAPLDAMDLGSVNTKVEELNGLVHNPDESWNPQSLELLVGANAFWAAWQLPTLPGVPLNRKGVQHLMAYLYAEPVRVAFTVTTDQPLRPADIKAGCFQMLSPEESLHALIMSVARDIIQRKDQTVLHTWRRMILSSQSPRAVNNDSTFV